MDAKKAGLVTAGVLAVLVAVAPLASATDKGGEAPVDTQATCEFVGGGAGAASEIAGDSLANAVAQAPIGGPAAGNVGNCSEFLNDNDVLNDNEVLSNNDVDVNLPEAPIPTF